MPRYRVLVIAEAANPEWVSVPLIGWSLSQALAKVADVHLVTHVRNRPEILRAGLIEGRDFTAIDNESIAGPAFKISSILRGGAGKGWTTRTGFSALAYYSFEHQLWRQFEQRIASREFDIVHRITPLSPTNQSIIAKRLARIGVPFVLGPLNGGVPWPKGFTDRQHQEREWLAHVRWLYKLMPAYQSTRRCAAAIIVGSKYTASEMPRGVAEKCIYIPENGVAADLLTLAHDGAGGAPLRAAFVGRLVPYKGADMLLAASAEFLRNRQLELWIIGDGPQRSELEAMVAKLGISSGVHFLGWLAHADVQSRLRNCDIMVLPSIREFGGGVVIEAMALGVVPIVADYGGPSELVDDCTGIRVPFNDKNSLVDGLRGAIADVIHAPEILSKFGDAARRKVKEKFTWDAKAKQIADIYDAVMSKAKQLDHMGLKL